MKKILLIIIISSLIFASSCSNKVAVSENDNSKIKIMTTIFPIYDMCREIIGNDDNIELSWLLDNGVDLHNFNPSADDIINIGKQDLFLYIGGESDKWVDDINIIKGKKLPLMNTIKDYLKVEELKEGMETPEEEEEEGEEEGPEYDEHIWLSLKNMQEITKAVLDEIMKINPNNAAVYTKNAYDYIGKLEELDREYKKVFDLDGQYVMLFADRFPFRYMASDYNIEYFAAFLGCSAETEASFKTMKFLTEKIDEYNIKTVWVLEGSDRKIANTIIANSLNEDAHIAELNSLQSINRKDDENGATYINIMYKNLETLKKEIGK